MRVLGARLIVKEEKLASKTEGGLVLPGREQQQTNKGAVISIGEGAMTDNGSIIPMRIKVGERVCYTAFSGTPIIAKNGDTLLILNERDIIAILEDGE